MAEKKFMSKFRESRYNRENAPAEPGPRSQAASLTGKTSRVNKESESGMGAGSPSVSGIDSEEVGTEPGTEQKRARELHMSFDDEGNVHHVHAVHDDGSEEHSDHASRDEAMYHGAKHAGVHIPDKEAFDARSRKPSEAENEPDADDYAVESL